MTDTAPRPVSAQRDRGPRPGTVICCSDGGTRSAAFSLGDAGLDGNRLLLPAASIELAFCWLLLFVGPLAALLGHAPPPAAGWAVALAGVPLVIAVDALDKRVRTRGVHRQAEPEAQLRACRDASAPDLSP